MSANVQTSIEGRKLGQSPEGNLVANGIEITREAVDAVITIGAENANVRAISVQLKDANAKNIAYAEQFEIVMFANAAGTDFVATGGSTGVAQGAKGKILAQVAKKLFRAISDTTGLLEVTYTDTGTDVGFFGVRLPSGRVIVGGAVTNT